MQHIEQLQPEEAGSAETVADLWVPGEYCAVHLVDVPGAPRRKWPVLLPWLLEEHLLSPVDANHLVPAGDSDGKLVVLSVAKDRMRHWLEQAQACACEPRSLLPDYLALPWQEGVISIAVRVIGERAPVWLVRYGAEQGFAARPQLAMNMLQRLLAEREGAGLRVYCSPGDVPEALQTLQPEVCGTVNWQAQASSRLNLLSGEFKPTARLGQLPRWWSTAALLVLSVTLCFAWLGSVNQRLSREVEILRDTELAEFHRRFPGVQLQAGNVRSTVEKLVSDRFLQREQLQAPATAMLQELDAVIRDCGCQVNSLQLDVAGGQLQLAAPVVEGVFNGRPGLTLQTSGADTESRMLRVSSELLK